MNELVKVAGVADLIMAQQKKVEYKASEIAHITNVMAGETSTREHRRTSVEERIEEIEAIFEEEEERDLQTTEKFELQRESENTIAQTYEMEGGVRVSAAYGPYVQVESNFGVRNLTSTERRSKTATKFSREVTERSVERIKSKERELRRARRVKTVEHFNRHELTNALPDHQIGVYRWIDKVYTLQNYRYGLRLMLQCVVQEPGSVLRILQARGTLPAGFQATPPSPFDIDIMDITRDSYLDLASRWNATDVPEPPPEKIAVPYTAKFKHGTNQEVVVTGKIRIPRGYKAIFYRAKALATHTPLMPPNATHIPSGLKVTVGTCYADVFVPTFIDRVDPWGFEFWSAFSYIMEDEAQGELPVSISAQYNNLAIAINVTVSCELTTEGEDAWRAEVYEALFSAYSEAQSRYDEQIAAARSARGGVVGRSPAENKREELVEIKRSVIEMLRGTPYSNWGALSASGIDDFPNINAPGTIQLQNAVEFLEHAFEWENASFKLHPYFWGDRVRWEELKKAAVPDPLHTDFLRSGAGTILVPVRPGHELLVLHYLATDGDIWTEETPPALPEEFAPLLGELELIEGEGTTISTPKPEGDEWAERIPTELVALREDALPSQPIDLM